MNPFRLLGLVAVTLSIGLAVGTLGPWAHTGADSLSRTETSSSLMLPGALWIALLTQCARDPRRARHWQPWAAFGIASVTALSTTADIVRVAGSHVDGYGTLTIGWGLTTAFVVAHVLVPTTLAFAWTSRGRISRNPPPWPSWWEVTPEEPLRAAVSVVGLGAVLLGVGSCGPWAGSGGLTVNGLELDGAITLVLAVVAAGIAISLHGPPAMTTSLRAFVLPLGGAALAIGLLALGDLPGSAMTEARWGLWTTVGGGMVTVVGGAMLALVPLPNVTTTGTAPPRWARGVLLPQTARTGPPLPSPPTA